MARTWWITRWSGTRSGMEVMVTFNVSTGLDMASGAREHMVNIQSTRWERRGARWKNSLYATAVSASLYARADESHQGYCAEWAGTAGCSSSLTRTFVVTTTNGKRTSISRQQLPTTPAYAFTDYRARAQTIKYCVVNIGKSLRDFNERLFTSKRTFSTRRRSPPKARQRDESEVGHFPNERSAFDAEKGAVCWNEQ